MGEANSERHESDASSSSTRNHFFFHLLPLLLLGILLVVAVVTVFTQASSYGIASDEQAQDEYGHYALAWYMTLGKDTRFMTAFVPVMNMPQHGVIFEVVVAIGEEITGEQWQTRAVICGLAGVAGVIGMALCGVELGGWWLAFLAALSLWLFPRFYGSIYNNSKDIPFTSVTLFVLWAILLLMRKWDSTGKLVCNAVLVGFLIGLAVSIRVTAIMWYGILCCLFALWWLGHGRQAMRERMIIRCLARQLLALGIVGGVSFVAMICLWPYIFLNPVHNLYDAISTMSKYPWYGPVLFAGHVYSSQAVPPAYVPGWLVVGSPLPVVVCAMLGIIAACVLTIRKRKVTIPVVAVILALLVPLVSLIVSHATLYNGPRQFLFLYAPLILLAAYGFVQLLSWLKKYKVVVTIVVVVALVAQGHVEWEIYNIHPYEYMYFNPLVGGIPGATGNYEMDYYLTCNKAAADWLAAHYRQYTHKSAPTVQVAQDPNTGMPYLPKAFVLSTTQPDFYISTTNEQQNARFPGYRLIDVEQVQGYQACVVKSPR